LRKELVKGCHTILGAEECTVDLYDYSLGASLRTIAVVLDLKGVFYVPFSRPSEGGGFGH
jgi:hypothetical protein